ncbi:MAG: hypothetical protein Q4E75_07130 [bacterium]|nr:hypothetical protein [bacterium]
MKKPKLSSRFDVDDIRKLREYDYERKKKMTDEEWIDEINKSAEEGFKRIEAYKKCRETATR